MRIGTNHGSLSDRILSRYGDTPLGMVESALEFLRICEDLNYYNIVISMKASNTQVMVQAYRLLVQKLDEEGLKPYPLHLGVTEAGEAEDGRIKSAVGIGTLLEDGLGDTVRVSLTESPEFEVPVAQALISRYTHRAQLAKPIPEVGSRMSDGGLAMSDVRCSMGDAGSKGELHLPLSSAKEDANPGKEDSLPALEDAHPETKNHSLIPNIEHRTSNIGHRQSNIVHPPSAIPINPYQYFRRKSREVANFGGQNVPRVIADFSQVSGVQMEDLKAVGHFYLPLLDKWKMNDLGADYIYSGKRAIPFMLANGSREILDEEAWLREEDQVNKYPLFGASAYGQAAEKHPEMNFVSLRIGDWSRDLVQAIKGTVYPRRRSSFRMFSRFWASFTLGAVIRTYSQPASTMRIVCSTEPSVSIVSTVVIDCTRIGYSLPIGRSVSTSQLYLAGKKPEVLG